MSGYANENDESMEINQANEKPDPMIVWVFQYDSFVEIHAIYSSRESWSSQQTYQICISVRNPLFRIDTEFLANSD